MAGYLFRVLCILALILIHFICPNCYITFFFHCWCVWHDFSIGPFPSKNRSSCSCTGYGLTVNTVPPDELEDLQRRRSEEYRQYQLRSNIRSIHYTLKHLNSCTGIILIPANIVKLKPIFYFIKKTSILFIAGWRHIWTHLFLPHLTLLSNIHYMGSKWHLLNKI